MNKIRRKLEATPYSHGWEFIPDVVIITIIFRGSCWVGWSSRCGGRTFLSCFLVKLSSRVPQQSYLDKMVLDISKHGVCSSQYAH